MSKSELLEPMKSFNDPAFQARMKKAEDMGAVLALSSESNAAPTEATRRLEDNFAYGHWPENVQKQLLRFIEAKGLTAEFADALDVALDIDAVEADAAEPA